MNTRTFILKKISSFKEKHGFSNTALSLAATKGHKVVANLFKGDNANLSNIEKIEDFIDDYEKKHPLI